MKKYTIREIDIARLDIELAMELGNISNISGDIILAALERMLRMEAYLNSIEPVVGP